MATSIAITLIQPKLSSPATSAASIRENGFAVLPQTLPRDLVTAARAAVADRLNLLLEGVDEAGCDVLAQQYSFHEICHRKRLRWDLRMPATCDPWNALISAALKEASPLLEALCEAEGGDAPRIVMAGAVVSREGAGPQSFHADGGGGELWGSSRQLRSLSAMQPAPTMLPAPTIAACSHNAAPSPQCGLLPQCPCVLALG